VLGVRLAVDRGDAPLGEGVAAAARPMGAAFEALGLGGKHVRSTLGAPARV
jgi:hypothetical protein